MTDLLIIGGGAAGLTAAIAAAQMGLSVIIIEKEERVGRKLLATGNGQCNLSNRDLSLEHFHGSLKESGLVRQVFTHVPYERVEAFWKARGIELTETVRGKLYPRSLQASSVLNNYRKSLEDLSVKVLTGKEVHRIRKTKNGFSVILSDKGSLEGRTLLLCAGGKASPSFGANGEGYQLAREMKMKVSPLRPGICRLLTSSPYNKRLQGLRLTLPIALTCENEVLQTTEGEVLFTEEGLSGPAILDLSRKAGDLLDEGKQPVVTMDLASEYESGTLFAYLLERFARLSSWTVEEALEGFIHKKMIPVVLLEAKIERTVLSGALDKRSVSRLINVIKAMTFSVSGLADFKEAQVTVGGVVAEEVDDALMSKRLPGLFLAGEVLDVDGDCGGYNLTWAASSGIRAAEGAFRFLQEEKT